MFQRPRTILILVLLGFLAHLLPAYSDEPPSAKRSGEGQWQIIERIGNGFVAGEKWPSDMPVLKRSLSKAQRLENFNILWEAIDRHYSFFELKKIDWKKIKKRYHFRVKAATTVDDYYRVLFDLVRELKAIAAMNLDRLKRADTLPEPAKPVDPEITEELRALGYLGD